jgi:hypothetical protein
VRPYAPCITDLRGYPVRDGLLRVPATALALVAIALCAVGRHNRDEILADRERWREWLSAVAAGNRSAPAHGEVSGRYDDRMSARAWCILLLSGCGFHSPAAAPASDAAVDGASIDGPDHPNFCLGNAVVMACLTQMPAAPIVIKSLTAIDTDTSDSCSPDAVGASAAYCILAGSSITINGGQVLSAHGSRPLVLMSSGAITVMGAIDVAGHLMGFPQATGPAVPPATGAGSPCAPAPAATNGGGGGGGSFGSIGGGGGADDNGKLGGVPPGPVVPTALRGGCSGEAGPGGGPAGGGGGAVALLAVTQIQIDGMIDASGGGGRGSMNDHHGGGGGGAGGMIEIDAPMVSGAGGARIFANGGSGGEGSGGNNGRDGNDAPLDPNMAAIGGTGGSTGGDGGRGANRNAQGGNAAGAGGNGTSGGGGGGGGGGVGVIQLYQGGSLPGTVSPPPGQALRAPRALDYRR